MTSGGELATRMFLLSHSTSFALSGYGSLRERPCQRRSFITSIYDRLTMLLFDRTRLEMLNVSQNRISSVNGLASVPSLVALNLGGCPRSVFVPWLQRCIAHLRAEGRGR